MKRWQIITAILFFAAILAGAAYLGARTSQPQAAASPTPPTVPVTVCDVEKTIAAPGSLANTHQASLEMPVAGRLAEVLARPGETIKAGQVVARLDDRPGFRAAVDAAKLNMLEAQQKLEALPRQAQEEAAQLQLDLLEAQKTLDEAVRYRTYLGYPDEIKESQVNKARDAYQQAQKEYTDALKAYNQTAKLPDSHPKRVRALQDLNSAKLHSDRALSNLNWVLGKATEEELQKADAEVSLAQARLQAITERLATLQDGPAALDLARAEEQVSKAQADLAEAERAVQNIELRAPFDGIVLEVKARQGESLATGSPLMTLSDPQALEAVVSVIEEDLPLVQVGQAASLFFDALPDAQISGSVERIVPQRLAGDRPLYSVYITLDQVPTGLVEGMTVDATIILERVEAALCLPRALVRASSQTTVDVKVWTGEHVETRAVQVGLRGDTNVAILSGLKEGEQVVAQ